MAINKVVLQGNLTRDPELRYTPQGKSVCEINVAHNEKRGDKNDVVFMSVVFWEKTAEFVSQYFQKGSQILIEGRLIREAWEKDGQKHEKTKIMGERAHFCGGGSGVQDRKEKQETYKSTEPRSDSIAEEEIPF